MKTITSKELNTLTGAIKHVGNYHVQNQYILTFETGTGLQSYDSLIVVQVNGNTYIGKNWNYSRTTSKYRSLFLNETTKETETKINNGTYIMIQD